MALVNVVRYENHPDEVVGKYTEDDIRLDSQLIVYPAQTAFFARGGKILDEFTSGTYTINSENIPLLNKIINLPFGKESPFGAEVWFVNQTTMLDCTWGSAHLIFSAGSRVRTITLQELCIKGTILEFGLLNFNFYLQK